MAGVTEKLHFKYHLVIVHLYLSFNSQMCTVLDRINLRVGDL